MHFCLSELIKNEKSDNKLKLCLVFVLLVLSPPPLLLLCSKPIYNLQVLSQKTFYDFYFMLGQTQARLREYECIRSLISEGKVWMNT